jgi:hypothetical protein
MKLRNIICFGLLVIPVTVLCYCLWLYKRALLSTSTTPIISLPSHSLLPPEYPWVEGEQPLTVTIDSIEFGPSRSLQFSCTINNSSSAGFKVDKYAVLNNTSRLLSIMLQQHISANKTSVMRNMGGRNADQIDIRANSSQELSGELYDFMVVSSPETITLEIESLKKMSWSSSQDLEVSDALSASKFRTMVRWQLK